MEAANTLDYYDTAAITAVKSFKVPALGHFFNLFSANLQREEKILEASVTPGTGSINLSVLVIDSLA